MSDIKEYCVHDGDVHGGRYCETHKQPSDNCFISALKQIARGEGRFDRDPHIHAMNGIEDMKQIAEWAIGAEVAKSEVTT